MSQMAFGAVYALPGPCANLHLRRPAPVAASCRCRAQRAPERRRRQTQTHAEPSGPLPLGSGTLGGASGAEPDKVQRLLQRDRKELTGVEEIGASFRAEFDDGREGATEASGEGGASANGTGPSPSSSGSPFGAGAPAKPLSPFGAAALGGGGFGAAGGASAKAPGGPANPFSGAGGAKLFTENPARLSPTMEPDSFTERPWWQTITFGQIVIVLSFTTIIALMIGTFFVVLKAGGVHFNE